MVMEVLRKELPGFPEDDSVYDSSQFEVTETTVEQGLTVGKNKDGKIVHVSYKDISLDALGVGESRKPFNAEQLSELFTLCSNAYKASSETSFTNKFEQIADTVAGKGKGFGLLRRIWIMAHSGAAV